MQNPSPLRYPGGKFRLASFYVQLFEKNIPEFRNNLIVLDGDVPQKPEYKRKARTISDAGNFLFLPLVIEKSLFSLLKEADIFADFQENYSNSPAFSFDVCYNHWPLEVNKYNTNDYKKWFEQAESAVGEQNILFEFWCSKNSESIEEFIYSFIEVFNSLAERQELDALPPVTPNIQEE